MLGRRKAIDEILCYEQWLNSSNSVDEVMASEPNGNDVLETMDKICPRKEGTQQWNLHKMHGAFKMEKSSHVVSEVVMEQIAHMANECNSIFQQCQGS